MRNGADGGVWCADMAGRGETVFSSDDEDDDDDDEEVEEELEEDQHRYHGRYRRGGRRKPRVIKVPPQLTHLIPLMPITTSTCRIRLSMPPCRAWLVLADACGGCLAEPGPERGFGLPHAPPPRHDRPRHDPAHLRLAVHALLQELPYREYDSKLMASGYICLPP